VAEVRKRWRSLPVLFVSGHLDEVVLDPDPNGRPADLLAKPFTPEQLGRRVRQALDRRRNGRRPVPSEAQGSNL
jgi:DNA-binding response OmpR family regulator